MTNDIRSTNTLAGSQREPLPASAKPDQGSAPIPAIASKDAMIDDPAPEFSERGWALIKRRLLGFSDRVSRYKPLDLGLDGALDVALSADPEAIDVLAAEDDRSAAFQPALDFAQSRMWANVGARLKAAKTDHPNCKRFRWVDGTIVPIDEQAAPDHDDKAFG